MEVNLPGFIYTTWMVGQEFRGHFEGYRNENLFTVQFFLKRVIFRKSKSDLLSVFIEVVK